MITYNEKWEKYMNMLIQVFIVVTLFVIWCDFFIF